MASQAQSSGKRRTLGDVLLVVLLAWAVLASALAAFAYMRAENLSSELTALRAALTETESELRALRARVVLVNIAIDYGNGTVRWFNSTPLPTGSTVLKALLAVASRVEYTYGAWGAYVTSIDGVAEKILAANEGYSWLWYIYETGQRKWVLGPVAADQQVLKDGDTVMWRFEHWKF
ncbi:MAG: DUF4430 domain-containing protein [Thermofilaceae archaeon]